MADGAAWPVTLRGVTETVTATQGPAGAWNAAALGVHAPSDETDRATARTWGRTRTRRNFGERGEGYVQFAADPVDFVEAALAVREEPDPVLDSAAAWARVEVERLASGEEDGTSWVDWALDPIESAVERRTVPVANRGRGAVLEATVLASRLDVPAYDRQRLESHLTYLEDVAETCGGPRERAALRRLRELTDR